MARPLPNTNRPADAKYTNTVPTTGNAGASWTAAVHPPASGDASNTDDNEPCDHRGTLAAIEITPQGRNSHTTSDSRHAVTAAVIAKRDQSNRSRPNDDFVSLMALRATIAMTAAPIP